MRRALLVLAVAVLCARPVMVRADDCAVLRNAALATLQAPSGLRQFLAVGNRPERLMSVAAGDTVYIAMAPGQWMTLPRSEVQAEGVSAAKAYRDCHAVGQEEVDGHAATVYAYTAAFDGAPAASARAWIGRDGLIYRQALPRGGVMRYEFKDVKPPR